MDEKAAAAARRETTLKTAALVVLLERLGGRASFTEAEHEAILERRGGAGMMTIHIEIVQIGEGEPEVQLALTSKAPEQGELPV